MNREQAIQAAQQIGVAPGDEIWMQNEGMMNPHLHGRNDSGEPHVDMWAVSNNGGQYEAQKRHSDDR